MNTGRSMRADGVLPRLLLVVVLALGVFVMHTLGDGMEHGSGSKGDMDGMMSREDMRKLEAAKGPAFDRAFASMMIDHHRGAIAMAKDEKKNGRNAKAKKLADDVVKNQSTEVAALRTLLDRL